MKRITYTFIFSLLITNFNAQNLFYQDIFNGGVSGAGMNLAFVTYSPDTLVLHIEDNSIIKKAFLFTGQRGLPNSSVTINNIDFEIDASSLIIGSEFTTSLGSPGLFNVSVGALDITPFISITDTTISITPSAVDVTHPNPMFGSFYVLILYENQLLPKVNCSIFINQQNSNPIIGYELINLNPIDTNKQVGLSINGSAICDTIQDGSYVFINDSLSGLIGGNDPNSIASCGVIGSFYHQNNSLFGLSDDTANSSLNGTDVIANIQPYINDTDSLNIRMEYQTPLNINVNAPYTNIIWETFLTYSTVCDTFSVNVPDKINVCRGDTAQILVSGGTSAPLSHPIYEWLPQVGLSCYDCNNPVFNGDSTMYYTVRIWNNDSCSKVMPVHVIMQENPVIPDYIVEGSDCVPNNTGHVYANAIPQPSVFSIDGGVDQSTTHFYGLTAGAHQLTVTDAANGCTSDTSLIVPAIINVTASIDANPLSGELPLEVDFSSSSSGNTSQYWYLEQDTILSASFTNVFNQSGAYPATLIAYDTHPHCSDTAQVIIQVETPFKIIAPTLVQAPSAAYSITTYGVIEMKYTLYNSLGQKVYETELKNISDGQQNLWQRRDYNRATYLYRIEATGENGEKKEFTGKVVVM